MASKIFVLLATIVLLFMVFRHGMIYGTTKSKSLSAGISSRPALQVSSRFSPLRIMASKFPSESPDTIAQIQFQSGLAERSVPEIKLLRSPEGNTGVAFFTFKK
mmetsp:Transcript_1806/g.2575  ORF Transcript_1806/g.2575 Transcript_1806/m.2575 type:complete len:104 (-) Transcript_1806:13-324(-)